jgi:hypothetical protein
MKRPDPVEILVAHQVAALVRCGRPIDAAQGEAEDIVATVLEDMARIGLRDVYLGVALRRSRVYRYRCQGIAYQVICERLGISRQQASHDYEAEMVRLRDVG